MAFTVVFVNVKLFTYDSNYLHNSTVHIEGISSLYV